MQKPTDYVVNAEWLRRKGKTDTS